mgnify:CR=1 FL=1
MEKYTANLRVILCANSTSRIIGPIRSRCLLLRVGAPSEDEVSRCFAQLPESYPVSRKSSRSARSSRRSRTVSRYTSPTTSRSCSRASPPATSDARFSRLKHYTRRTRPSNPSRRSTRSSQGQSSAPRTSTPSRDPTGRNSQARWPRRCSASRARSDCSRSAGCSTSCSCTASLRRSSLLSVLLDGARTLRVRSVSLTLIGPRQTIAKRLLDRVDEVIKGDIAFWAAFYEHRLRLGSKPIFHLEGLSCLTPSFPR